MIGGAVSVAVDYVVTTQVKHEEYTWQKAAVSFTVGAVGGAIGAGIVAPAAAFVGGWAGASIAVPVALSPTVAAVAQVTTGMALAGVTNAVLSTSKRTMLDALDGEEITTGTVIEDIQENFPSDLKYGAIGYGIGYGTNQVVSQLWKPSTPVVESLLDINKGQKITVGVMQAASTTLNKSLKPLAEWKQKKLDE